ncbi:hypothetical protein [Chroococcidiopsis sp. SAG 2025]|nr:hypothetical protein [Chroococcidiopsis sp. SAG 2025]
MRERRAAPGAEEAEEAEGARQSEIQNLKSKIPPPLAPHSSLLTPFK